MIKKSWEMFLEGLWCWDKIQTTLPPLRSAGEMCGDGINAHQMCYCVCTVKVGKSATKIPWYKTRNIPDFSFFKKWELQNNKYSVFFDKAQFDKSSMFTHKLIAFYSDIYSLQSTD